MERELLLLGLLKREKMHGYQLHEFIDSYMQTCVDIKKPTAYYMLDKMEKQGLIVREEERTGKRPTRRVYSLTPAGETRFQALIRQNLSTYVPSQYPSNTGFIFLEELSTAEAVILLQQRQKILLEMKNRAEGAPEHNGAMQYVVDHQVVMLGAELNWLENVIEKLQS